MGSVCCLSKESIKLVSRFFGKGLCLKTIFHLRWAGGLRVYVFSRVQYIYYFLEN